MCMQEDANEFYCRVLDKIDFATRAAGASAASRGFADVFEGTAENAVTCAQGHRSGHEQQYTDMLLPVARDLFESLALMLRAEHVDGYRCAQCAAGMADTAAKALHVRRVAQLAVFTLQRFAQDARGEFQKDHGGVRFPLALDLRVLCHAAEGPQSADRLRAAAMPWCFFEEDGGGWRVREAPPGAQRESAEALLLEGWFVRHLDEFYAGAAPPLPAVAGDPFCALPRLAGAQPPEYKVLRVIICHAGTKNSGHYLAYKLN